MLNCETKHAIVKDLINYNLYIDAFPCIQLIKFFILLRGETFLKFSAESRWSDKFINWFVNNLYMITVKSN